tara:strand:- start:607 stop:2046 length:1440 start_codon:yes stop_codon:yes gene_type:complete
MRWLLERVHSSWLIAWASVGFLVGVWLALYAALSGAWLWLGVVLAVLAFVLRCRWCIAIVVLAFLMAGLWYGSIGKHDLARVAPLYGKVVTVTGRVKEDVSITAKNGTAIQLDSLRFGGQSVAGSVWTSVRGEYDIARGDRVTIRGQMTEGFGNFIGVLYRANIEKITRPVPGDVGRVVRDWFAAAVRLGMPEPQASLGIGFLTGQKSALPEDLSEALRIAGLTHIVVASGYNLTILVRLSRKLFVKVSKYLSTTVSALMIAAFMAVTGLSPSMTRAGLVSGLSLATWYYGRSFHPLVLLPFAAAVTVAIQPSYLWGDLGWQLSFAAFAGVMIVAPLFQRYFFGDTPPGTIRQILGETVAAHIATVPIIAVSFGALSNVAVVANLLIVPLVPLAMLLTFIVGVVGLTMPFAAEVIALPATWLLGYMTSVATYVSSLPWAQFEFQPAEWMPVAYVIMLALFCWHMQRVTHFRLREVNILD